MTLGVSIFFIFFENAMRCRENGAGVSSVSEIERANEPYAPQAHRRDIKYMYDNGYRSGYFLDSSLSIVAVIAKNWSVSA